MKLRCKSDYRNEALELILRKGQVVEVADPLGEFLLRDAPGCFSVVAVKQVKAPVKDKAVKAEE